MNTSGSSRRYDAYWGTNSLKNLRITGNTRKFLRQQDFPVMSLSAVSAAIVVEANTSVETLVSKELTQGIEVLWDKRSD